MTREEVAKKVAAAVTGAAVMTAIDQIGNPKQETIDYAHLLIAGLPAIIIDAAHEPYGARAVIYSLLLDNGNAVRAKQLQHLQDHADPDVYAVTRTLMPEIDKLDRQYRLPVIDIAIPALKQLSLGQYQSFRDNLVALIEMDGRVDLFEWSLQKILFNHLDGQFFKLTPVKARYSHVRQVKNEIRLVLSVMAHAGHQDQSDAEKAFIAAVATLSLSELKILAKNAISLSDLDHSLAKLAKLRPLVKPKILKACAVSVAHDQQVSPVEVEILRAFSDVLDCPMPPVI